MSKTFKSMHPDSVLSLQVGANHDGAGVYVRVLGASGLQVAKSDAPALALAILEAAGLVRDACSGDDAEVALEWLHSAVARRESEAKEAADREALEHEAEALYLAGCETLAASASRHTTVAWDDLSGRTQDAHLSVARKARELHGKP